MPITQEERENIARNIESLIKKAAGVIRNRIMEGMNFDDACNHKSVTFWSDQLEKEGKKLNS